MNVFIFVALGLTYVYTAHAYVYVQVQKGDKDISNVDALIHKEVPSDSVGAITDQLKETFQNKKMTKAKYKRFEVRKRTDDKTSQEKQNKQNSEESKQKLDKFMLAVDTGAKPDQSSMTSSKTTGIDIIDKLLDVVKEYGKNSNSPLMRAQEQYNINSILDTWKAGDSVVRRHVMGFQQPEIIQFRNSAKPSLKFEVNSDSIIKLARELLSSPTVRSYADEFARKAAVIFKVIKQELKKDA